MHTGMKESSNLFFISTSF